MSDRYILFYSNVSQACFPVLKFIQDNGLSVVCVPLDTPEARSKAANGRLLQIRVVPSLIIEPAFGESPKLFEGNPKIMAILSSLIEEYEPVPAPRGNSQVEPVPVQLPRVNQNITHHPQQHHKLKMESAARVLPHQQNVNDEEEYNAQRNREYWEAAGIKLQQEIQPQLIDDDPPKKTKPKKSSKKHSRHQQHENIELEIPTISQHEITVEEFENDLTDPSIHPVQTGKFTPMQKKGNSSSYRPMGIPAPEIVSSDKPIDVAAMKQLQAQGEMIFKQDPVPLRKR